MSARGARALLAVCLTALALSACSGDGDGGAVTTTTRATGPTTTDAALAGQLPPKDAADIEVLYGDQLAALGVKLTPRGGLIDLADGRYEHSGAGTHLALYVEPIGERTPSQYIAGILDVGKIFADDVFDRWPGLRSFDVCQEPPSALDASPEPVAVTQIAMTRAQSEAIDWDTATVVDLVGASQVRPQRLRLTVSSLISGDPEYQALVAEAAGAR